MILDSFSRDVVVTGAHAEGAGVLAARLRAATVAAGRAAPGLDLHTDSGAPSRQHLLRHLYDE